MNFAQIEVFSAVREFHDKYGAPSGLEAVDLNKMALKRLRLINEELGELSVALDTGNLEEFVDAICDLAYVVAGTGITYGQNLRAVVYADGHVRAKPVMPTDEQAADFLSMLTDNVGSLANSINSGDRVGVHIACRKILVALSCQAVAMNVPIGSVFAEVHRSNMTKTPLDEHRKGGKGPGFTKPELKSLLGLQEAP